MWENILITLKYGNSQQDTKDTKYWWIYYTNIIYKYTNIQIILHDPMYSEQYRNKK